MKRIFSRYSRILVTLAAAIILPTIVASCSYAELSTEGAKVIAAPNLQVKHCRYIGPVVGKGGGGGGQYVRNESLIEHAMNDLRNKAAKKGATHVLTGNHQMGSHEGTNTSATVMGTAYDCSGAAQH